MTASRSKLAAVTPDGFRDPALAHDLRIRRAYGLRVVDGSSLRRNGAAPRPHDRSIAFVALFNAV
jgi:hypothetical protein